MWSFAKLLWILVSVCSTLYYVSDILIYDLFFRLHSYFVDTACVLHTTTGLLWAAHSGPILGAQKVPTLRAQRGPTLGALQWLDVHAVRGPLMAAPSGPHVADILAL